MQVSTESAGNVETRFLPDVILPGQVQEGSSARTELVAERRLMLAVLEEAVVAFQTHAHAQTTRGRRLFFETAAWFASDDHDWPFAFVNLCHGLDLDVDYIRVGLRRWRESMRGAPARPRSPFRRVTGHRRLVNGRPLGIRPAAPALTRARCRASSSGSGACSG